MNIGRAKPFRAGELPNGWEIAVRPEKAMADGSRADAGRIVDAVAQLLD